MRITNKMMTNNMLSNINKNKVGMTNLEQQYSTGKKIQRPSDDPIVTVRALKLRTNLSEISQYVEKNIPDAKSWMGVTESALNTVNDILKQVNTYCNQGSTDTMTVDDRSAIVENLEQMKNQIYQEGNTNYAGRYVFTGYKTDTSLIFNEKTDNLNYNITENSTGKQIQVVNKVSGSYELSDFDDPAETFSAAPTISNVYRIQLAYGKLSDGTKPEVSIDGTDFDSNNINITPVTDPNAYLPAAGQINYIPETGELILASDVYDQMRNSDDLQIKYTKSSFEQGDLRPEHYFNCEVTDSNNPAMDPVVYEKKPQKIQYEVNYNQKLTVNTEGSDAITHQIGRRIDDIYNAVNDVAHTESNIAEVNKRLTDTSLTSTDKARYNKMLEQLDTELNLKQVAMQKAFGNGITSSNEEQDRVNTAVADLGSREVRLDMTENRLSSQKVDFTDLLSNNEDVDMVDTVIKYNSAQTIYNASLSAAAKVVKNTLLDFL